MGTYAQERQITADYAAFQDAAAVARVDNALTRNLKESTAKVAV